MKKKSIPGDNCIYPVRFHQKGFLYLNLTFIMTFVLAANMFASVFSNDNLVDMATSNSIQQQNITGTVTDGISGESLPGANVLIKGSNIGAVTDNDGKFSLPAPNQHAVLVVSFIGYITQEVTYTGQGSIDIKLVPDVQSLDEIVVVGYGTVKKKDLTSAITSVSSEDFLQGASNSVIELIRGKVAGLAISSVVADPNSEPTMQIRGVGSMNASNAPLVIIDGVPGSSLSSVAQQDIESFSVLKDGAAAAIYGTRGANGVIIITTKQAQKNDKMQVSYDGYVSTQQVAKKPDVLSHDEFVQHGRDYDYGSNTDWFKLITRPSFDQNHNLAISHGTERSSIRASVTYRNNIAITETVDRKEYGGRINFLNKFYGDRFETAGSLSVRNTFSNEPYGSFTGVYDMATVMNPTMPVYNPDGSYYLPTLSTLDNPVSMLNNGTNYHEGRLTNYDLTLKWNFTKSLNSSLMYSQQVMDNEAYQFLNKYAKANVDANIEGVAARRYDKSSVRTFEWNNNYELNLGAHNLKLLAGYSYQDFTSTWFTATNSNYPTQATSYNNLGAGSYLADGRALMGSGKIASKLIAFYGRAMYSFNDFLLANATIRHEGSTKYGVNNKWGDFFSLSGAWRISEMGFMQNMVSSRIVDNLKLRIGYGETGRDITNPYQSLATYGPGELGIFPPFALTKYLANGQWITVQGPTINANPDLKWERAINYNAGLDFSILNSSFSGSIDLFIRDSKDLLYNYTAIQPPMIKNSIMLNIGTIRSSGVEWDVIWRNDPTSKFKYSVNFIGSYTKTKVVSLSNDLYTASYSDLYQLPAPGSPGMAYRVSEGKEVGLFYGWRYAGVDESGNVMVYNKAGDAIPGALKSEDDKTYIGNGIPRWQLSMTHSFAYKNFDLTLQLKSSLDYSILNLQNMYEGLQYASLPNVLRAAYGTNSQWKDEKVYCDYFLENGNYLKLDVATLGYNIQGPNARFFSSARIYMSVSNVFTITNYTGSDPANVSTNGLTPSIETVSNYPVVRTYTAGVKLNF